MTKEKLMIWLKQHNFKNTLKAVEEDDFCWLQTQLDARPPVILEEIYHKKLKNYLRICKLKQYD